MLLSILFTTFLIGYSSSFNIVAFQAWALRTVCSPPNSASLLMQFRAAKTSLTISFKLSGVFGAEFVICESRVVWNSNKHLSKLNLTLSKFLLAYSPILGIPSNNFNFLNSSLNFTTYSLEMHLAFSLLIISIVLLNWVSLVLRTWSSNSLDLLSISTVISGLWCSANAWYIVIRYKVAVSIEQFLFVKKPMQSSPSCIIFLTCYNSATSICSKFSSTIASLFHRSE